jgi:hypothetical protein
LKQNLLHLQYATIPHTATGEHTLPWEPGETYILFDLLDKQTLQMAIYKSYITDNK